MSRKPRVIVVDDSAFARTVLARVLRESGRINVVATARDGADALERIAELDPDVITLDLTMPGVDGLGVLRALRGRDRPRVIVVSISSIDTELGVEAMALGAVDVVAKPSALANERLAGIANELISKTLATAEGLITRRDPLAAVAQSTRPGGRAELVMIGTSTGGPQALTRLVTALPASLPVPVAMVLHIPIGYTEALAARLDKVSSLRVLEAHDGLALEPGMAVLARGGTHLHIERTGTRLCARVSSQPLRAFMPSVDELFLSGVGAVGAGAFGVVLTGMGDDGLAGARAIAAASGTLLSEDPSTCVVYGMPRAVYEAGLGAIAVPLDRMAEEIAARV